MFSIKGRGFRLIRDLGAARDKIKGSYCAEVSTFTGGAEVIKDVESEGALCFIWHLVILDGYPLSFLQVLKWLRLYGHELDANPAQTISTATQCPVRFQPCYQSINVHCFSLAGVHALLKV